MRSAVLCLILLLNLGCTQAPSPQSTPVPKETATTVVEVTFDTMLASDDSAQYSFTKADGETVTVISSKETPVKVDPKLLDVPEDPEMPPSANLDWLGEKVTLLYDEQGQVLEIKALEK